MLTSVQHQVFWLLFDVLFRRLLWVNCLVLWVHDLLDTSELVLPIAMCSNQGIALLQL